MYHAGKNTVYVSRLAAVVLGSFERRVPGHTRPSPGGWGLALLLKEEGQRGIRYRNTLPMRVTTALATMSESTIRNGAIFQMLLVLVQSLPCSMAAVELAAGVRKARQQAMVMRMTGSSDDTPLVEQ